MNTAFISYSVKDELLAKNLHNVISLSGIETFLAGISIEPGSNWTDVIFLKLQEADWVFFLASKNSIDSAAVQQEIGASLIQKKTIIPLLVDIAPEELPGWMKNYQAINLQSAPEKLHEVVSAIAEKIKVDKFWVGVLVGALIAALVLFLLSKK